ncbi:hypothetical protein AWC18_12105 [Mycolicibacter nonchromogenicus]|uniref:Uncharacterized protein n=1 Tax=Mycolicibacter nonchromogenicus TaxID=1782 RepID=A0A1X1ZA68_MYCNO|nr:hypothetical protein [Mycolicibacter nonchromogenicus]ORW20140.1 hypothetical protein AWC18_12105 [Mycolicibacter nonchromogenicus]
MSEPGTGDNAAALVAIAAITGQSVPSATEIFCAIKTSAPQQDSASAADIGKAVNRLCTRIGLAPALAKDERKQHIRVLRELAKSEAISLTLGDLHAWSEVLRTVPEKIPTIEREPVALPQMPEHQEAMWATLFDFEETGPPPWVLVGGQMTALHLAEHSTTGHRPTDDGDMVVGVWTRRDALRGTAAYLTDSGFTESPTSDGFGYRFARGNTTIDVMIPEGLDRQQRYPTTTSGRPGLQADGGNQALTRAERVPVNLSGRVGYIRRPNLLGALVVKARAWIVDTRNPERHAQDLVALADVALGDPRAVISQARPDDRHAIRVALQNLPVSHRLLRATEDPSAVHAFLSRLAQPPS